MRPGTNLDAELGLDEALEVWRDERLLRVDGVLDEVELGLEELLHGVDLERDPADEHHADHERDNARKHLPSSNGSGQIPRRVTRRQAS